jgi:hypothetical protein
MTEKEKDTTETNTAIQIIQPADIDRLAEAFKKFQDFKVRLLSAEDTIKIDNKPYLKKSAWRKWALACGVSDQLLSLERVPPTGLDDKGDFCYRVVVKAYHKPTGRSAVGLAVAAKSEKDRWAHEEHDILTLAHTRAKNRAISDLTGGGEVSAEEVVSEIPSEARNVTPSQEAPQENHDKTTVSGTSHLDKDRTLDILRTKEPLKENPENIKQFPLIAAGNKSVGMLNVHSDSQQAGIVPTRPFSVEDHALTGFLIPRVLDQLKAKHNGFQYAILEAAREVTWIYVSGPLDDNILKNLQSASAWAFARAFERSQETK